VILVRPKAPGFDDGVKERLVGIEEHRPRASVQRKRFAKLVEEGHPASDIYARFPGKTPWRHIGEIAAVDSKFPEAIRAQWVFLFDNVYRLHKKLRYFLASTTAIEFGYVDENANMVVYREGPIAEATEPWELSQQLRSSGFFPGKKPREWIGLKRKQMEALVHTKKNKHLLKPYLTNERRNENVAALKWWNPSNIPRMKFGHEQKKKRGRVIACGHSTPWKGWMRKVYE
jgi:hypothetical protein